MPLHASSTDIACPASPGDDPNIAIPGPATNRPPRGICPPDDPCPGLPRHTTRLIQPPPPMSTCQRVAARLTRLPTAIVPSPIDDPSHHVCGPPRIRQAQPPSPFRPPRQAQPLRCRPPARQPRTRPLRFNADSDKPPHRPPPRATTPTCRHPASRLPGPMACHSCRRSGPASLPPRSDSPAQNRSYPRRLPVSTPAAPGVPRPSDNP